MKAIDHFREFMNLYGINKAELQASLPLQHWKQVTWVPRSDSDSENSAIVAACGKIAETIRSDLPRKSTLIMSPQPDAQIDEQSGFVVSYKPGSLEVRYGIRGAS